MSLGGVIVLKTLYLVCLYATPHLNRCEGRVAKMGAYFTDSTVGRGYEFK